MGTNVEKNSQTASQLQPAVGGEIVLYQPDNNIRLEVQLDTLVKDMNRRQTECNEACFVIAESRQRKTKSTRKRREAA